MTHSTRPIKIISWNIRRSARCWEWLVDSDVDVALLQEAAEPPRKVAARIEVDSAPWRLAGRDSYRPRAWRSAVVKVSDRVEVEWLEAKSIDDARSRELGVSRFGTLAAAHVTSPYSEPFVCVSMYAPWMRPHACTESSWIISDTSAHRVVSDLSVLVGQQSGHRIVAAGDLNILHGYGEHRSTYWAERYQTIFGRMKALGLPFVGPEAPNGEQAEPWPNELPGNSKNVPTYHTNRQKPETATRQLDFVFASEGFADSLTVRALNRPEEWGPSDHCRVEIELA